MSELSRGSTSINPVPNAYLPESIYIKLFNQYASILPNTVCVEQMRLILAMSKSSYKTKLKLLVSVQAKRLKAIMMAAAEFAAVRLKDLPSTNHKGLEVDHRDRAFRLLDKNGDGKISIEELMEVMVELGAQGEDAREMMQVLDANSDGSLSTDEFDLFQKQVNLMRNLEDRDDQYKRSLNEKLQMVDGSGLIQVYRKELGDRLAVT